MLQLAQIALGLYGALLIVGGVMGKVKSGSAVSLVAGSVSGLISLYACWAIRTDPVQGLILGLLVSLLLTGIFLSRFLRTRKFMPAGIVLLLSIAVAAILAIVQNRLAAPF